MEGSGFCEGLCCCDKKQQRHKRVYAISTEPNSRNLSKGSKRWWYEEGGGFFLGKSVGYLSHSDTRQIRDIDLTGLISSTQLCGRNVSTHEEKCSHYHIVFQISGGKVLLCFYCYHCSLQSLGTHNRAINCQRTWNLKC